MKRYITLLAAVTLAVTLIIPTVMADERKDNSGAAIARNLDIFNSIYKELNTFYVDTIDAQKSIETAINAMLDDIDPYTEYIPAKSQDDFLVISTGQYGGIGSYIQQRTTGKKGVYISGPYKDSPAAKAGLRAGDRITAIEDVVLQIPFMRTVERQRQQPPQGSGQHHGDGASGTPLRR